MCILFTIWIALLSGCGSASDGDKVDIEEVDLEEMIDDLIANQKWRIVRIPLGEVSRFADPMDVTCIFGLQAERDYRYNTDLVVANWIKTSLDSMVSRDTNGPTTSFVPSRVSTSRNCR